MIASNKDRRKELQEIAAKRIPGFGPRIDIGKAAQMARKLICLKINKIAHMGKTTHL